MEKELIINATATEVRIALLEDKKLVELQSENPDNDFAVGDLYHGRIKRLVSGLNAAFVDVGYQKDAFLHYYDLGPQLQSHMKYCQEVFSKKRKNAKLDDFKLQPEINKNGKIEEVLSANQQILVQIAKEPISTKGPRITSEVSLAGRFLVLVPFIDKVSISSKLKDKSERSRLINLIKSIKPKNFGVIIRTVAEGKKVAELDADLRDLLDRWNAVQEKMAKTKPPTKVLGELNRSASIIRDLLNPSFNKIYIDNEQLYHELKAYLKTIAPDRMDILEHYQGKLPIFDAKGIERQIKSLFGVNVTMKSGAYLVVEHTEALHVIDVNSGNTAKSKDNQETNALRCNIEAAEEIARQLRLRDMGGIIVVDFIDMQKAENRKQLQNKMKEFMKNDRAKHHILPPSKFGLIQITRQRVRPEMSIKTTEIIPNEDGNEKEVRATILLIDDIERDLKKIMSKNGNKKVSLYAHPFIEAYLKRGLKSFQRSWFMKYKKWIAIEGLDSLPLVEYHFYDEKGGELEA